VSPNDPNDFTSVLTTVFYSVRAECERTDAGLT